MATEPTDAGAWECDVDLAALQAPAGSLKFDFDVEGAGGTVDESPDGKRAVEYRPPKRRRGERLGKSCRRAATAPVLTIDASSGYHVAATCEGGIGYAVGLRWPAHGGPRSFKSPTDRFDLGPQLAVDGDTLYLAFTRYRTRERGRHVRDGAAVSDCRGVLPVPDAAGRIVVDAPPPGTKRRWAAAPSACETARSTQRSVTGAVAVATNGSPHRPRSASHSIASMDPRCVSATTERRGWRTSTGRTARSSSRRSMDRRSPQRPWPTAASCWIRSWCLVRATSRISCGLASTPRTVRVAVPTC